MPHDGEGVREVSQAGSERLFVHRPRGLLAVHMPEQALVFHQRDPVSLVLVHNSAVGKLISQEDVVGILSEPIQEQPPSLDINEEAVAVFP